MDRYRKLSGENFDMTRRASHSGFESPSLIDRDLLQRRKSMPANLIEKDEKTRKLHHSSACVNLIEESKAIKVVEKAKSWRNGGSRQMLGQELQEALRNSRRATTGCAPLLKREDTVPVEVKKSSSFENKFQSGEYQDVPVRMSNSETKISGLDVDIPFDDMSSDDDEYY